MLYGDEKLREMARSILPSTAREWARWKKATIKRSARRQARQLCHQAVRDFEGVEDEDFTFYPEARIRLVRRRRQDADKLHHFESWAIKVTDHLGDDPQGRLCQIRGVLPKGLIGWHACQHLENYAEFDPQRYRPRFSRRIRASSWYTRENRIKMVEDLIKDPEALQLISSFVGGGERMEWTLGYRKVCGVLEPVTKEVETKAAVELRPGNAATWVDHLAVATKKQKWISPPQEDLIGLIFPASKVPNPAYSPVWHSTLRLFLGYWKQHKGDIEKVRTSLYQGYGYMRTPWWKFR